MFGLPKQQVDMQVSGDVELIARLAKARERTRVSIAAEAPPQALAAGAAIVEAVADATVAGPKDRPQDGHGEVIHASLKASKTPTAITGTPGESRPQRRLEVIRCLSGGRVRAPAAGGLIERRPPA